MNRWRRTCPALVFVACLALVVLTWPPSGPLVGAVAAVFATVAYRLERTRC